MSRLIANMGANFNKYENRNFYHNKEYIGSHRFGSLVFGKKIDARNLFFIPKSLNQYVEEAQNEIIPDYDKSSYEYVRLLMFLKLLKFDFDTSIDELYVSVLYGLNVYVDILKEACRNFVVFKSLKTHPSKSIDFKLLFGDPIIGNSQTDINLYTTNINTMVVFDSFLSIDDLKHLKTMLDKEHYDVITTGLLIFRAIKHNIPLYLYIKGYHKKEHIKDITKHLLNIFYNKYKENPPDKDIINLIYAIFYLLAIYYNISKTLENLGITKKEWINISDLESFLRLYDKYDKDLAQNRIILNKDIINLKAKQKSKDIRNTHILRLKELENEGVLSKPSKRNWLAHSGFEGNITLVKCDGKFLSFSYDKNFLGMLEEWLLEG